MQGNNRDYSILKGRIIKYLKIKGITKYLFYKDTGIANGILSQTTGISEENLLKFVSCYKDINLTWLLTGEGNILYTDTPDTTIAKPTATQPFQKTFPQQGEVMVAEQHIPVYESITWHSLDALFANSLHPQSYISLPNIPKCDGAIRMWGDTMSPELQRGDLLIFSKIEDLRSGLFYGQIYLLSLELEGVNYVMVQYVEPSDCQNSVRLVSKNDHYPSKDIPMESIRSLAMVKASVRYRGV